MISQLIGAGSRGYPGCAFYHNALQTLKASSSRRVDGRVISVVGSWVTQETRLLSGSLYCRRWYRCIWWPLERMLVVSSSPPAWLSPRPWPSSRPWESPFSHHDTRRCGLVKGPPRCCKPNTAYKAKRKPIFTIFVPAVLRSLGSLGLKIL